MLEDDHIIQINIENEMKSAYIDYSMSVIVSRALPDARDGLKPVQRRVLYGMDVMGNTYDKPHKKSANCVGEVMGKYHPHGDSSIYGTVVRLAQNWAMRYTLVDGHGNFGNVDGAGAAAMRYTEVRLARLGEEMLTDIGDDTVDFVPTYDNSRKEPVVLPSRFPNLLVNGAAGIAVGMATNMPPHNLTESINASIALLNNPDITIDELIHYIPAPDFPTGGTIYGYGGVREAYHTGRGRIVVRAVAEIESEASHESIIVRQIPYGVNKAELVKYIAQLVNEKKLDGIADVNDETDHEGMRIVIKLRSDANSNVVLNKLYKMTPMQSSFSVNNVALVNGRPCTLNLKQILEAFTAHRHEVTIRRTRYRLAKTLDRIHVLDALIIASQNIDEVISIIRSSKDVDEAKKRLTERFGFTDIQVNAIVEMRLRNLTALEQNKLEDERDSLRKYAAELQLILDDENECRRVMIADLEEVKEKYGDERRTQILPEANEMTIEDLTPNVPMAVFMTRQGYIKRISLDTFERQNRATRGKGGIKTKEDDDVGIFFTAMMHDKVLFFSDKGTVYSLNVYDFPEGSRQSKGLPVINILPIEQGEKITAVVPVKEFSHDTSLIMLTQKGYIKRIELDNFANIRRNGIIAIGLEEGDTLNWVNVAKNNDEILIGTSCGMAIRFAVEELRPLGRSARGVNSMKLRQGDMIIGSDIVPADYDADLLVVTSDGFGKRSKLSEFRSQNRGGIGLIATKFKTSKSRLVALTIVNENDDIMVVTANGVVTRINAGDISRQGRPATGVKIQNLQENDSVITVNKIVGQSTDDPIDKAIENAIDNAVEQTKLLDVEDKPEA